MQKDSSSLTEHHVVHVAELCSVFSDTSRVRIPSVIVEQEMNIASLAKSVGNTEPAVSHHMRIVQARRNGKEVFY